MQYKGRSKGLETEKQLGGPQKQFGGPLEAADRASEAVKGHERQLRA